MVSKRFFAAVLGVGALALGGLTAGVAGANAAAAPHVVHLTGLHAQRVCAKAPAAGHATCFAKVLANKAGAVPQAAAPLSTALSPTQLKAAYGLPSTGGTGRTVAIVDAFGYPNLERDLTIYRNFYGMPACTTANGCLKIRNQTGGTTAPRTNLGWDQEQALDVDAVSAACPGCNILVVQAKSASFADLGSGQHSGIVGRCGRDLQQLRRRRRRGHDVLQVLQPPGDRGHRVDRGQRLRRSLLPGLVVLRHRRGRHLPEDVRHQPGQRDRVERGRLGLLDAQHRAGGGGELQHRLRQAGHGRRLRRGGPEHRAV